MRQLSKGQFRRAHYEMLGDLIAERVAILDAHIDRNANNGPVHEYVHRKAEVYAIARTLSDMFENDRDGFKPERFAKRCNIPLADFGRKNI